MSERIEAARPEHKPAANHGGMSGSMGIGALQPERGQCTDAASAPAPISVEQFHAERHYAEVSKWWEAQNWPVVPLDHLPSTGILVSAGGVPAACAWIYKTDSAICLLEWVVANPEIRREARTNTLSVLISSAKLMAKAMGFQDVFMSIKHESLSKRITQHGFVPTDQGMTNYFCNLSGGANG